MNEKLKSNGLARRIKELSEEGKESSQRIVEGQVHHNQYVNHPAVQRENLDEHNKSRL